VNGLVEDKIAPKTMDIVWYSCGLLGVP
jgi:hypothetical protein